MADKPQGIPGSMPPGGHGDAARRALDKLGGKTAAGKVAAEAAKGAAGGTVAGKVVGGGVQGAVVQGAIGAAKDPRVRGRPKAMVLLGATVPLILLAPVVLSSGDAAVSAGGDQLVTQERAHEAAEASGYDPEHFSVVYDEASRRGVSWEIVSAMEHWQANQNSQTYCPPAVLEPPVEDPPVEDPAAGEPDVQIVGDFAHPVTGSAYRVASAYGTLVEGEDGSTATNLGIDFRDEVGSPIVSAGYGTVAYSGWNTLGGNMVWIDLTDVDGNPMEPATQIRYMHLETALVGVNAPVTPGESVGTMGETGSAALPVLHFEVLEANEHVDPAVWLEDRGIVVNHGLPVDPNFSDPCAPQGPGDGGPPSHGNDPYEPAEGFPAPPPVVCPTIPGGQVAGAVLEPATDDQRRGRDCIAQAFPDMLLTSAYRTAWMGYESDHHTGNAVDFAVSPYNEGTPGWAYMYALTHWAQVNADNLGVRMIIFADWRWDRETGWTPYTFLDANNDNARHTNHVHISFFGTAAMPDAQNLIPAFTDQSGMPYVPGYNPKWSDGLRFFPIDDPALSLEGFPTDGSGGLIIGDGGGGFLTGDFRSPYRIDRRAFGPDSDEAEYELKARLENDPAFARGWVYREEKGWVASTVKGASDLAEKAESDYEYATAWVSAEFARLMTAKGLEATADLNAGRELDTETMVVSISDDSAAQAVEGAYIEVLSDMPLAGMNESSAGRVYAIAQAWHFGEESVGGATGGGVTGVICSPAAGATLVVEAVGGPRGGEQVVMDSQKLGYAATAVHVAKENSISPGGQIALLMTIFQESTFQMYANSSVPASLGLPHDAVGMDHDSTGIYQQRGAAVGWAWGPLESNMDVTRSTRAFLGVSSEATAPGLVDIAGWQTMPPGSLAQAIQVSAHPTYYDQWEQAAMQVLGEIEGIDCEASEPTEVTP